VSKCALEPGFNSHLPTLRSFAVLRRSAFGSDASGSLRMTEASLLRGVYDDKATIRCTTSSIVKSEVSMTVYESS
jgi:hypothetical protein